MKIWYLRIRHSIIIHIKEAKTSQPVEEINNIFKSIK